MLAVCARNRSLIGTPFSANWDTWGFDDPHKTQPAPAGLSLKGGLPQAQPAAEWVTDPWGRPELF